MWQFPPACPNHESQNNTTIFSLLASIESKHVYFLCGALEGEGIRDLVRVGLMGVDERREKEKLRKRAIALPQQQARQANEQARQHDAEVRQELEEQNRTERARVKKHNQRHPTLEQQGLKCYTEVWQKFLLGTRMENSATTGGSCQALIKCWAVQKQDGVQVAVALKVLKNDSNLHEAMRELTLLAALREEASCARVSTVVRTELHPDGIVVSPKGSKNKHQKECGTVAVLLEWVRDQDATQWHPQGCTHSPPPSDAKKSVFLVKFITSCTQTLRVVHSRGFAHRDIKKVNMLVHSGGLCTYIDWGGSLFSTLASFKGVSRPFPHITLAWWSNHPAFYADVVRGVPPVSSSVQSPFKPDYASPRAHGMHSRSLPSEEERVNKLQEAAQAERYRDFAKELLDVQNSQWLCGAVGTPGSRSPQHVDAHLELKQTKGSAAQKVLFSRMSCRLFAQAGDCYASGLVILGCITGVSIGRLAKHHLAALASQGHVWLHGDTPTEEDLLFRFIQSAIEDEPDNGQVFRTLWAFRGLPECQPQRRSAQRWSAIISCLRGLLLHSQEHRWSAERAFGVISKI